MRSQLTQECEIHPDIYDCPDNLVSYIPKFDEYGINIHDGGSAFSLIQYCPWCGQRLPDSKRDAWFAEIRSWGFEPDSDDLPERFRSDAWCGERMNAKVTSFRPSPIRQRPHVTTAAECHRHKQRCSLAG